MYETCRLVRIFDPNFASQYLDSAYVDSMAAITPLRSLDMLDQVKQEAPLYRAAAHSAGAFDKSSVADYTEAMLTWWRTNGGSFPAWALAARIVFASSPNSASCERVFALLRNLFGELRMRSLADYVQAALMLTADHKLWTALPESCAQPEVRELNRSLGPHEAPRGAVFAWRWPRPST